MSDHNDDFGTFLIGFIVGGISGAIAALLLAPQSGEETRTMIKDKTIELRDQATVTVEESLDKAEKAANEAIKKAETLLEQAKTKAAEVAEQGQVVLEETKTKATKAGKSAPKGEKAKSLPNPDRINRALKPNRSVVVSSTADLFY
jgi:gas vesicle protein